MQYMGANNDIMGAAGYDDYYEEDYDTEEAETYQQLLNMKGAQLAAGALDPTIQRAEQMLGDGYEIMEEELDEDYEPTVEEIEEYAKYLGMDLKEDRDMFFIAKEGLKAPLPDPWKPCRSPGGNIYYFNFESQELQKEHPCDDYYKKLYATERASKRRKKEEMVIKKQIKQQQQKQQQQMASSLGSTTQNPQFTSSAGVANGSGNAANTSLQQMLLMNMSGLDASTSVVNDRVQFELEQLLLDQEEKKIQHERARREELKKLELAQGQEKRRLEERAKDEVEELKRKLRSSSMKDKEIKVQQRRTQLQLEKDKRLQELRDTERSKQLKQEQQLQQRLDKRREDLKREEDSRHKVDLDTVKQRWQAKLEIERERVREENSRLLEESGDIDFQVRAFRGELMDGQVEQQKYECEDELRKNLAEIKQENKKRLEKERERIANEQTQRLDRDKEKEQRRLKQELAKLEDRKEELKREVLGTRLREEKRRLEKGQQEELRKRRQEGEEDVERAKDQVKLQIEGLFEAKEQRQAKDMAAQRDHQKSLQDKYEREVRLRTEAEQTHLETQFKEDFDREKEEFTRGQNERSETYHQISKDIQQSRAKVRDLEAKIIGQERELKKKQREIQDLDLEKRGKERQLKSQSTISNTADIDALERQLNRDLKDKQEELDRLRQMLRDRQLQLQTKATFPSTDPLLSEDYASLTKELAQIKALLFHQLKNPPTHQQQKPQVSFTRKTKKPITDIYDYPISEIQAFLEVHLPRIKHKREKQENDRVILRQLVANIERNRVKLRKDLEEAKELSSNRRIAIQSLKDKVDDQAKTLHTEESTLKDKCDFYRRQEDKLRTIKQKLDIVLGQDRFEECDDASGKEAVMKEIQIDYDKYLRVYQQDKHSILGTKPKNSAQSKAYKAMELQSLTNRWSDYLHDLDEVHDLKPLLGLVDKDFPQPERLGYKYEMSSAAKMHRVSMNHVYENEYKRAREGRTQVKRFLQEQQEWLSKLRKEISYVGAGHHYDQPRTLNYVGSNETLFALKHTLSAAGLVGNDHYY